MYGFHSYGTSKSKWDRFEYANSNAISSISQWDNEIKKGLEAKDKKRYNIPVMLVRLVLLQKQNMSIRGSIVKNGLGFQGGNHPLVR